MHEWQVYLDKFGVWRIVHVDDNWKIPNGTRVKEFKTLLLKYNGKDGKHGFYDFKNIKL